MATGWETLTRSAKLHVLSRGTLNPKVKESALVAFQEDAEHPRRHPPPTTRGPGLCRRKGGGTGTPPAAFQAKSCMTVKSTPGSAY